MIYKKRLIIKMVWTDEKIKYLVGNYSDTRTQDLADRFGVNYNQIMRFAKKFKLKKSKEHRSKMIAKRNKMVGRDLTHADLKRIASKFKTRTEFKNTDSGAYSKAYRSGVLEDVCSHMTPQSYSIPQLICKYIFDKLSNSICEYNTRQIIKPYELDLYYEKLNFAVEYNGKRWHNDNENDNTNLKLKLCEEKNIYLLIISERNRRYEDDIKTQIIENLDTINNILNSKYTKEDILKINIDNSIYDNLIDEEYITNTVSKYINYSDFITTETSLYEKLKKMKQLDKYTHKLIRSRISWDDEKIIETISKYKYVDELIKNDYGCYLHIKRNKKNQLLKDLKYKRKKKLNK